MWDIWYWCKQKPKNPTVQKPKPKPVPKPAPAPTPAPTPIQPAPAPTPAPAPKPSEQPVSWFPFGKPGAAATGSASGGLGDALLATGGFLVNTNASVATPTETYHTNGLAFKKGDMPAGNIPQLRYSDGTVLPAQFDNRNVWPDGSLRWCEVSWVAQSLAGGASRAIYLWRVTGSYNNGTTRTLADITGSSNIKLDLTNVTDFNGSVYEGGTLTASFNTASLNPARIEVIKAGPVCLQYRAWMPCSPQVNAHLVVYFYVTVWTKQSDGTRGPISHLARVHNGFIALPNATKYHYDANYNNNGVTAQVYNYDMTVTSIDVTNNIISFTGGTIQPVQPVSFTSTGTLPGGITANTVYYCDWTTSGSTRIYTTGDAPQTLGQSGAVNITTSGTGVVTMKARVYHHHHSDWFCVNSVGKPFWTSNEPTVHFKHDKLYLKKAGILPPYDITLPIANTVASYSTMHPQGLPTYWPFTLYSKGTSPRIPFAADMRTNQEGAPLPDGCARAFISQDLDWAQYARLFALNAAHQPNGWLNEATGKIPTCFGPNNGANDKHGQGDYPGLGTNHRDKWYFSNLNHSTGAQLTVIPTGGDGPWLFEASYAHVKQPIIYTLVTEGGAHLIDIQVILGNWAEFGQATSATPVTGITAFTRAQRVNASGSGSTGYYGVFTWADQERAVAFRMEAVGNTIATLPDTWAEAAYFDDMLAQNAEWSVVIINNYMGGVGGNGGSWVRSAANIWSSCWEVGYMIGALALCYKMSENNDVRIWADHMMTQTYGLVTGVWPPGCVQILDDYQTLTKTGTAINAWAPLSEYGMAGHPPLAARTTTAGSPYCYYTPVTATGDFIGVLVTDGTKVKWPTVEHNNAAITPPTPLASNTWYYCRDVNTVNKTFNVAATLGGPAIVITATGTPGHSNSEAVVWQPTTCLTTISSATSPEAFLAWCKRGLGWAAAVGITNAQTTYNAVAPFHHPAATTWSFNYESAMTDSFES